MRGSRGAFYRRGSGALGSLIVLFVSPSHAAMSVVTSCSALPIGLRCLPASRAPGRPQLFHHAPLTGITGRPSPAQRHRRARDGTGGSRRGAPRGEQRAPLRMRAWIRLRGGGLAAPRGSLGGWRSHGEVCASAGKRLHGWVG